MKGEIPVNKLNKYKICGEIYTTITGKLLYLILDELANRNGEIVIPQRKLSDALQISKGTVSRNLRRLRNGGYIDIQPQYHNDGGRAANKYKIK
jgi:DNA-binding MarR family transcriptional regulator